MVYKCSVIGCKVSYNYTGPFIQVYPFPNDPIMQKKWLKAIHRDVDLVINKNTTVCYKHFREEDLILEDIVTKDDGSIEKIKRKFPKLKENAIPFLNINEHLKEPVNELQKTFTSFKNLDTLEISSVKCEIINDKVTLNTSKEILPEVIKPIENSQDSNLSEKDFIIAKQSNQILDIESDFKNNENEKRLKVERCQVFENKNKKKSNKDIISSFEYFVKYFESKKLYDFDYKIDDDFVCFYKIDPDIPTVPISLKFFENFTLKIYYKGCIIPPNNFKQILEDDLTCKKWSSFESILKALNSI